MISCRAQVPRYVRRKVASFKRIVSSARFSISARTPDRGREEAKQNLPGQSRPEIVSFCACSSVRGCNFSSKCDECKWRRLLVSSGHLLMLLGPQTHTHTHARAHFYGHSRRALDSSLSCANADATNRWFRRAAVDFRVQKIAAIITNFGISDAQLRSRCS